MSGLFSLPLRPHWGLWWGCELLGWRPCGPLLSCGPSAVSGMQKVPNKWVLSKWRPGPFSHSFGGDFRADS